MSPTTTRAIQLALALAAGGTLAGACVSQNLAPLITEPPELAPSAAPELSHTPEPSPAVSATPESSSEPGPVHTPELLTLRAAAQRRILSGQVIEDEQGNVTPTEQLELGDGGTPFANGNALGEFVPIENEQALQYFYEQLERLATGRSQRLRILAYGASHTQGDLFTGYLRYYLQSRFGNGGQGFMQMALINPWYRTLGFKVESNGFKTKHAQRKTPDPGGYFGLLGAAVIGYSRYAAASVFPKNESDLELTADSYELYYFAQPRGGEFQLKIDEEPGQFLSTKGADEARYHEFQLPRGWHKLQVVPKGNGTVRLFGVSIERSEPGIVVDTLGINGTRNANMLLWNEQLWAEQMQRRDPALVMFAYGTNETVDTRQPISAYEQDLMEVLRRFRAALPNASCLLVGPGDFPKEVPGGFIPRPRLEQLISVQREVAPKFGCGFWDTYAFMGGEGSMHRWATAYPRMGQPDHIHLSPRGYVKMGMVFGDALMRGYDEFHAR